MSEINPDHVRLLEAVLFAAAEPVSEKKLSGYLPEDADFTATLNALKTAYQGRGVELNKIGNTYAFRTAPDLADHLSEHKANVKKLSRAALETLSIIAYHQPVSRAEIEEIRGVALSKGTLDVLFEAGWIKPRGRRKTPGRPMTWGTTPGFLDQFGLEKIDDLPGIDDLKAAGLLDAQPAINAYSVRGEMELPFDHPDEDDLPEPLDPDAK